MKSKSQKSVGNESCRVLITGGPTRAYLDDVRYLSNYSSGGLAFELCRRLLRRKMEVALIVGPTQHDFTRLKLGAYRPIETAEEMLRATLELCRDFRPHFAIFAAAVLDFVPSKVRRGKVSSKTKSWVVQLRPFPKIIDVVGKKYPNIQRIGFKLETEKPRRRQSKLMMAEDLRLERGLKALCLNFLDEVKRGHDAYLALGGRPPQKVLGKSEIASELARFLSDEFCRLPALD